MVLLSRLTRPAYFSKPSVYAKKVRLLHRRRSIPNHSASLSRTPSVRAHLCFSRRPLSATSFGKSIRLLLKASIKTDLFCLQVKNPSARLGGLETSLFRTLHEAHPSASVDLSHQYRMNEDIMKISNELIYDQKLKCGSETIAKQRLDLPGWDRLDKEGEKWLIEALDPK